MERSTSVVTKAACGSREAREFDGCPACCAAAVAATERTVSYVLRRAALRGPIELAGLDEPASAVRIRIVDARGLTIALGETVEHGDRAASWPDDDPLAMRPDDFETVLDRLDLGPLPGGGSEGSIAGRLYAFGRSIGRFEVEIAPPGKGLSPRR
jgi:hypothetical protein